LPCNQFNYDHPKLNGLYGLLTEIVNLRAIFSEVGKFVNATGWLGFLTGLIQLESLNSRKNEFISTATRTLKLLDHDSIMKAPAGKALVNVKANNLDNITKENKSLSQQLQTLNNPEFLESVVKNINDNLLALANLQEKYDIQIVNLSMCNIDFNSTSPLLLTRIILRCQKILL
jgi:hypothetical protein